MVNICIEMVNFIKIVFFCVDDFSTLILNAWFYILFHIQIQIVASINVFS